MRLITVQCKAEMLRIIRNPYYVFWSLLMPIMFYFIFTRVVNTGNDDPTWRAHYLMSMATFSVMGSAIMTLGIRLVQERTQGWTTFIRITPLPGSVYFFGKMFGQTMMHLFSVICIFIAGYLINSVSLSAGQWVLSGLWILIGSLPFLAIGTLVGAMKRVDTASGVSNVIYMALAVAGGMWMPIEILPQLMQKIGHWLPSYNYGNGAWEIVRGSAPHWSNVLILLGYLVVFMLLSVYIRKKQEAV
ncbi:ABC transporter permease [Paenibacillus sp. VTT E-133280]|uniref:ABC transporter permease n=1 Tax=Paenibacillus TaxID=44249 RepID=UPI000BA0AF64|nr:MULTISPECIES: ABC transporter permease [unclassified Paenibacillus]MDH6370836.1 ABC-2 type transport system permease protein [Paenibacillus sp. PastF-3]OZQ67903.1 ABC transporter permease [Paenibacillus sp. VTT E-133280]OZQ90864.1 ABC transporter permease [Paenibacillus sp. VTT E-133291]